MIPASPEHLATLPLTRPLGDLSPMGRGRAVPASTVTHQLSSSYHVRPSRSMSAIAPDGPQVPAT